MSLQVSGKRTVLLSNEARREMTKQVRAMKEERRAALDARHKYLMIRLADAVTLTEAEVEDALISDDRVSPQSRLVFGDSAPSQTNLTRVFQFALIQDFFAANGSKKLIFFYQSTEQVNAAPKRPHLTPPADLTAVI